MKTLRRHLPLVLALLTLPALWAGVWLVRDLGDPALSGPGIPTRARELHDQLTPKIEAWARERITSRRATDAPLHDVPTTEWPMFTAVFYLMGTEALVRDWEAHGEVGPSPAVASAGAVAAARDLLLDPSHHAWVRRHWGDDYMTEQNVFFRSLLIAGLTSHERITHDGSSLPLLRAQVEGLSDALDRSPLGVLEDYPGECYPIDVLAALGLIRRADAVLGTDHSAFLARSRRAFVGEMADPYGLPPFRMDLPSGAHVQQSRGIGNSWSLLFVPDLWGDDAARDVYARYEAVFYRHAWWAEGFRELPEANDAPEWGFEIDAGPILDGFGTAASAFGIAAARRNGRFDHAYALSTELAAASFTLPGGTLGLPRLVSHAADAPYLGEAGIFYFLTVQPAEGMAIVPASGIPALAWIGLAVFFGLPALAWWSFLRRRRQARHASAPAPVPLIAPETPPLARP